MCLAKALYDNSPETPDELSFKRGDVLTVLEISPEGLDGWWFCELHGQRGIAPGNRLKVIAGSGQAENGHVVVGGTPMNGGQVLPRVLAQENVYEEPPGSDRKGTTGEEDDGSWKRRSWHINPDQVRL